MARIRTIKPEFPQSETIGRLSRDARLLFIQLWTICDDVGRSRGSSRILASLLYPFDDDAYQHMDEWLEELERETCVRRYQVEGNTYLQILNWTKHQKVDRPAESRIPECRESSRSPDKPQPNKTVPCSVPDDVPRECDGDSRGLAGVHRQSDADLGPRTGDLGPGNPPLPLPVGRGAADARQADWHVAEGKLHVPDAEVEAEVDQGVRTVLERCAFTRRRLGGVVRKALIARCVAAEEGAGAVAEHMARSWLEFQAAGPERRHGWRPEVFFGDGHWLNTAGWPIDAKLVQGQGQATVGMYRG